MSNDKDSAANGGEPAATSPNLPLFYQKPEALSHERHGDLRFDAEAGFAFARHAHVVPLNVPEFAAAARHYPIVFIGGDLPVPVAVLGVRPNVNLFVDDNGKWKEGVYIPSYVRRYPFIFVSDEEQSQFSLCIDRTAPHLGADDGVTLFDGEEASETTKNALEFCRIFQGEVQATQNVSRAIAEENLLTTNQANISLPGGEQLSITDFKVVDEARFNDLSDEKFLKLRKAGAITAIFCQLISTGNWANLIELSAAKAERE